MFFSFPYLDHDVFTHHALKCTLLDASVGEWPVTTSLPCRFIFSPSLCGWWAAE